MGTPPVAWMWHQGGKEGAQGMCFFLCFIGKQAEARASSWWSRAAWLGRNQLGGLYHTVLLKATALPSMSQSGYPACSQMIEWGNTSIVQRFKDTMD